MAIGRDGFRALAESSRDLIWVRDADGVLSYCCPGVTSSLGYEPEELVGANERAFIHRADWGLRADHVTDLLESNTEPRPAELRLRGKDGKLHWFELTDTNLLGSSSVRGIVTNGRDLTERKAVEGELIELSLHDALTGLPNRRLVMDRLAIALARTARSGHMLAVLFCDLDEFKDVNDSVGHEGGDRLLSEVARRVRRVLRKSDTVGRTGGDEFVVVCEDLSSIGDATAIAEDIRDVIEQPMVFDDFETAVSVSIGVVSVTGFEARTATPMLLLRNSDAAMYRAKRAGKARWALFDESLVTAATYRRELEPELRRALSDDEFVVHYQPIYDLRSDRIVGVEALLRWCNPTRGLLLPGAFIGLAEETGLIVSIGLWVLQESCAQMRRWERELGWEGWISVNLSAQQVAEPGLAAGIREILDASNLRADMLRLELTETALLRAGHSAAVELEAVRQLGVHVGMDDFGTGYASLTNLQQLPIDFLKIDRGFVSGLTRNDNRNGDTKGNAIVAAIAQIGLTLDLETIAEGVETEEQADLLRLYGCPYAQGFKFARPTPAAVTTELLANAGVSLVPRNGSNGNGAGSGALTLVRSGRVDEVLLP